MFNKKKILKKYQFFLIDLDGVIFDSKKNMNASWNECMKKFYLKQNFKQYFNYLGLPISDILKKIGIKRNIQNITSCYQTFSEKNLKLVKPYITVIKTLKFLEKNKIKFSIVTSKNKLRALKLIKLYKIKINSIHCSSKKKPGKPSRYLIDEAIKKNNYIRNKTCFIGDTEIDWKAAQNANVDFIFAEYGYGNKLNKYKASIKKFSDILNFTF
jgi:phosphoglycolate phosphatase